MGRKAKKIILSSDERAALELGYKDLKKPKFSRRCHIILLKSEGYTSKYIATLLRYKDAQPINNWVKRYEAAGLEGLQTKSGQGRKPILDKKKDEAKVKAAVQKERQRLKLAKQDLENELGKQFSLLTLKRFLKKLSADGNVSV